MVVVKDGIGYSYSAQAAFYTDARKITSPRDPESFITSEWSPWGEDNNEPDLIKNDIENCGVLSAGVESEARLAVGKSLDAYLMVDKDPHGNEMLDWVSDSEVNDFLEANESYEQSYRNIYNTLGYGFSATQILLNGKRDKINRIRTTDIYSARLGKRDKAGIINNLFLCSDWSAASGSFDKEKMKKIALLEEGWELDHLQQSTSGYEFAMLHRILKNGRAYYPTPLHRAAKAWVAITRSVPAIKAAINKNQMTIKYVITISDTYWKRIHKKWDTYTPEEKSKILNDKYTEIANYLTGEINAGKSITAGKYFDALTNKEMSDIEITVIDDKMKEGKMLPDSAAADKQILFSMFFNPAIWGGNLLGDGASGGAGSGSDIREATLVLLMLLHPERQNNLRIYNLVKNYNGWAKRLEAEKEIFPVTNSGNNAVLSRKKTKPRLVFRYSSSILTTLDKGKSQQEVTT